MTAAEFRAIRERERRDQARWLARLWRAGTADADATVADAIRNDDELRGLLFAELDRTPAPAPLRARTA